MPALPDPGHELLRQEVGHALGVREVGYPNRAVGVVDEHGDERRGTLRGQQRVEHRGSGIVSGTRAVERDQERIGGACGVVSRRRVDPAGVRSDGRAIIAPAASNPTCGAAGGMRSEHQRLRVRGFPRRTPDRSPAVVPLLRATRGASDGQAPLRPTTRISATCLREWVAEIWRSHACGRYGSGPCPRFCAQVDHAASL